MKLSWDSSVRSCVESNPDGVTSLVDGGGRVVATVTPVGHGKTWADGAHDALKLASETFGPLVAAVREMRKHQKAYFAARRRGEVKLAEIDLIESQKAEREVDRLLAELDAPEPKQGGLF